MEKPYKKPQNDVLLFLIISVVKQSKTTICILGLHILKVNVDEDWEIKFYGH